LNYERSRKDRFTRPKTAAYKGYSKKYKKKKGKRDMHRITYPSCWK